MALEYNGFNVDTKASQASPRGAYEYNRFNAATKLPLFARHIVAILPSLFVLHMQPLLDGEKRLNRTFKQYKIEKINAFRHKGHV